LLLMFFCVISFWEWILPCDLSLKELNGWVTLTRHCHIMFNVCHVLPLIWKIKSFVILLGPGSIHPYYQFRDCSTLVTKTTTAFVLMTCRQSRGP
jgi:hypothetical protein